MKTLRIFNFTQANFFIQNDCKIENCGYGHKDGKPYIRFICDEKFNMIMSEWNSRIR